MTQLMLCREIKPEDLKNYNGEYDAEQKMDGDRSAAIIKDGNVAIVNRSNNRITYRYPEVVESLEKIKDDLIIDGEMVVYIDGKDEFNEGISFRRGLKSEAKIKQRMKTHPVTFVVFDILYLNGQPLVEKPLTERRALLRKTLEQYDLGEIIKIIEPNPDIKEAWKDAITNDQEGIIIKKLSSQYIYGRSNYWLKVKHNKDAVMVFDSYEKNPAGIKLIKTKSDLRDELIVNLDKKPLHVQCAGKNAPPVQAAIDANGEAQVKIQYLSITKDKRLRMPSFKELIGE